MSEIEGIFRTIQELRDDMVANFKEVERQHRKDRQDIDDNSKRGIRQQTLMGDGYKALESLKSAMIHQQKTIDMLIEATKKNTRPSEMVFKKFSSEVNGYVTEATPVQFHKWAAVYDPHETGGIIEVAIVEDKQGQIHEVLPANIRFTDTKEKGTEKKKA